MIPVFSKTLAVDSPASIIVRSPASPSAASAGQISGNMVARGTTGTPSRSPRRDLGFAWVPFSNSIVQRKSITRPRGHLVLRVGTQ